MGSYREQLLKQTYGNQSIVSETKEKPIAIFSVFKMRFFLSILLFAAFAWLSMTGNSLFGISAKEMQEAIVSQDFPMDFSMEWFEKN